MNKGLVSIIIPTYNRANLVIRAIESALNQTYRNIELIVIDDGSKDQTPQIISQIKDPRIRYIRYEENRGASHARNVGLSLAKGEFISFLDSDDEFLPQKIEKQLEAFEKSENVGAVYCDTYLLFENKRRDIYRFEKLEGWVYPKMVGMPHLMLPVFMIRKNVISSNRIRFDEKFFPGEDTDFLIKVSKFAEFLHIPEPLCIIRRDVRRDRITLNKKATISAYFALTQKYSRDIKRFWGKERLEWMYYNSLYAFVKEGYKKEAIKVCTKVFFETLNIKHLIKIPLILLNVYKKFLSKKYKDIPAVRF